MSGVIRGSQKRRSPLARAWSSSDSVSAEKISALTESKNYFFLEAFFLPFFFALAMLALSSIDRLVRGRSIRTLIKKTSKRAMSVIPAHIDAIESSLE
jgi:hypothetical protein